MADFYHRRFNLLLCTTIVESGIDVPTANTIIINRADRFGLAQLHQLRGRVGRSHHRAYAYLVAPPKAAMTNVQLDDLRNARNGLHVVVVKTVACVDDQTEPRAVTRSRSDPLEFCIPRIVVRIRIGASMQLDHGGTRGQRRVELRFVGIDEQ